MTGIYCGNNHLDTELVNGKVRLGTPYGCMRKGVGVGLHLPYDKKFAGAYAPIDQRKIYCGNEPMLPDGYDSMGSLSQCLQKGVGIGKRQVAQRGRPRYRSIILPISIFLLLSIGIFAFLYLNKPSIVTKISNNGQKIIDWGKFMAFYIPTILLIGVVGFLFVKYIF